MAKESKAQTEEREQAAEAGQPERSAEDTSGVQTAGGAVSSSARIEEAAIAAGELQTQGAGVFYGFPEFDLEELREIRGRSTATGDFANEGGWQTPANAGTVVLHSPKVPVGGVKGVTITDAGPVDGHIRGYTLDEVDRMISALEKRESK